VSQVNNSICSRHDIAEILLELALNTNQSLNAFYTWRQFILNSLHDELLLYSEVANFAAFCKDILGAKS
jgi:hypothetical protein